MARSGRSDKTDGESSSEDVGGRSPASRLPRDAARGGSDAAGTGVEPEAHQNPSLSEQLRLLYLNTRDPQGRRWSLQRVAAEAARYGEEMSRAHVHALLTGKVENTTLRKVQVLGMVFGVGSMGLIHPLEPQPPGQERPDVITRKVLQDLRKHTGIIEKALTDARLQRAVLLLDGFQSEETLEQAAHILAELGEMERFFMEQQPPRKPARRRSRATPGGESEPGEPRERS